MDNILHHLLDSWDDLSKRMLQQPTQLWQNQLNYWQDYTKLCAELSGGTNIPFTDNRFKHTDWQTNPAFHFIQRTYLLLTQHVDALVANLAVEDPKAAQKLRFFTRQFLDALAPTNFANLNPEVLEKITATNGESLLQGMKQFLEDLAQGKGTLKIKMTDLDLFKLGENIAITPGKIIYQNDIMQLIQYLPATQKVYAKPVLIIPPWINKYYILDLQPDNSLVKWLGDQGICVFMISWVNATSEIRKKRFADYMQEGALTAIKEIIYLTKQSTINVTGYCIGGTLLGCTLAYLAKKKLKLVNSATFLTTLFDFSQPGELGAFIDEKQISSIEKSMQEKGYMDGTTMAAVFNALRANDLIWYSFVNNYLKGQKPKPFDLLYWNSDATNIPEKVHSFYLRKMYLENQLVQADQVKLTKVGIDLSLINLPSYFLAAEDDHIVPWQSAFNSMQVIPGQHTFVLTTSGHVAGVVNPPVKNKYGYWTSANQSDAEKFKANAEFHKGSWWTDWCTWLIKQSGELGELNVGNASALEAAPGSYVKVKLEDILT